MATAASPNVVGTLGVYCEGNEQGIYDKYATAGGWEPWLQLEFLPWLQERWPDTVTERDAHVYPNKKKRTDLLMHPSETFAYYTVIELKCESVFQDLTEHTEDEDYHGRFKARFKKDVKKIENGLNEAFKPAHCWVLGITRGQHMAAAPGDVDWGNYDVKFTTVGSSDIIVWSWYRFWQ